MDEVAKDKIYCKTTETPDKNIWNNHPKDVGHQLVKDSDPQEVEAKRNESSEYHGLFLQFLGCSVKEGEFRQSPVIFLNCFELVEMAIQGS